MFLFYLYPILFIQNFCFVSLCLFFSSNLIKKKDKLKLSYSIWIVRDSEIITPSIHLVWVNCFHFLLFFHVNIVIVQNCIIICNQFTISLDSHPTLLRNTHFLSPSPSYMYKLSPLFICINYLFYRKIRSHNGWQYFIENSIPKVFFFIQISKRF